MQWINSYFPAYQFFFRFSVRSVMHKYLEKKNEVNFDKIFNQMLGEYLHTVAEIEAPGWPWDPAASVYIPVVVGRMAAGYAGQPKEAP
jgi:hypothetical protein